MSSRQQVLRDPGTVTPPGGNRSAEAPLLPRPATRDEASSSYLSHAFPVLRTALYLVAAASLIDHLLR